MQERCGGEFSIDDHILRQTFSHAPDHPPQQALPGCVFAIARSVGFSIEGQRQAGSHQADHHERMLMTQNLFRSVLLWPTQVAPLVGSPSRAGAVEGQADPAAIIKGLIALGAADEGEQRLPRWASIEPLGEIAQGIVTERSCDGECASRRRMHQRLNRMKTRFAEDLADQQGPEQSLCRNLGLSPPVPWILEIPSKAKTPRDIMEQMTWRPTVHLFFLSSLLHGSCSSTSSSALAPNTSRTASRNS